MRWMTHLEPSPKIIEVLLLSSVIASCPACASAPNQHAPYERDGLSLQDGGRDANGSTDGHPSSDGGACGEPSTGCPCDVEHEVIECTVFHAQFGDYTRCSPGFRKCLDGAWGACVGDRVVGP